MRAQLSIAALACFITTACMTAQERTRPSHNLASPLAAHFDYQLGVPYSPARDVGFVVRDRKQKPAHGLYNICYINGFQTQPREHNARHWNDSHGLKLKDGAGGYVKDQVWDEYILDTRTPEKRSRILEIITPWIAQCASDGFNAIEIDNLDTYIRTDLISGENNAQMMRGFVKVAHSFGLEVAHKNAIGIAGQTGADFAIVENCAKYDLCDDYIDAFGARTFIVEYEYDWFEKGCSEFGSRANIVFRDVLLKPRGSPGHKYRQCQIVSSN